MAIQPIDLQTLFTQLDKVAKLQMDQKEGMQMQQALQSASNQKKTEEKVRSVNETHDAGEGAEKIKDKDAQGNTERKREREEKNSHEQEDQEAEVVRDPALGKNIDVSG